MQEQPQSYKDKEKEQHDPKSRDKAGSKEKKKHNDYNYDKNNNKRQNNDKNGFSHGKGVSFKHPQNSSSYIESIPKKNVSNFGPVSGSFVKERDGINRPCGNNYSFNNNRYNNNYHRQESVFNYWKSDNIFDNNNMKGNNSNLFNDLFDDFEQPNRINSQNNNNRFPFSMNDNYSGLQNVSKEKYEKLWHSSQLYKEKIEKYGEEIDELKKENEALKKKYQELLQSQLDLINNKNIISHNNNNNNDDGQMIPISISRTRLINESHGAFRSTAFKLVFTDNANFDLYNEYRPKLYNPQDQFSNCRGLISFEKDVSVDNDPRGRVKEVCILVQYNKLHSLYQADFPQCDISFKNTSIFNKIIDLANEYRVLEKFKTLYGRGRNLNDKIEVTKSPVITMEMLRNDWNMWKQVYAYNIYGRSSFECMFRIENFFKINDMKICYLRYDDSSKQFYGFEKGARVAICELPRISSMDYDSLIGIISPDFRFVHGLNIANENLIMNCVVYFFFVTRDPISKFISSKDRAMMVSHRIKEIEVYFLEHCPYPPSFIKQLYYLNIEGEGA